ncbi:DNA recombination and repair protein RecO [Methylophaga thiooxydans]|uniref:DNA repair protein RecO n=1 Tax=Methylophaga thiooxydans TaxID=392484 RepID=A0A0A0BDR7_9GAMM|nr:DNA repair protein RecO [Methylophaga thiooxydans]KGM06015.1 DNA recombination and repair protein RecO [Methylophaga thiooxydans]
MELTSAFVLHHRPFRETSLLVDALTRDHGRVSLVARGMRQQKKRQSHVLQLFQPLWISWYGYSELHTLGQAESSESAFRLIGKASLCGLYLNELLVRLLPIQESEPVIYDAYYQALQSLQQNENEQVVLRLFEKRLLAELGYGLVLRHEAGSLTPIEDNGLYRYLPDSGPQRQLNAGKEPSISGRSLRQLDEEDGFDETSLKEIKIMMRTVINYYLGGKPLHSRQLFAGLNQSK